MKHALVAEILELPVAERMRLVEAIWDSISAAPESLPLTEWQREELDRRKRGTQDARKKPECLKFLEMPICPELQ